MYFYILSQGKTVAELNVLYKNSRVEYNYILNGFQTVLLLCY